MRIAISSTPLDTGSQARGIGVYTRSLVAALRAKFDQDKYYLTNKLYRPNRDLVHFPFFDPFFLTLPWRMPLPTIVTVHDLIPLKYPEHFPRGLRGELKWQLQKRLIHQARAVITDSLASKDDIVKILRFDPARVHVIPLAPQEARMTKTISSKIIKEYHLPSRYILYVGDINWNKNVPGLVEAFGKLKSSAHLIIVSKSLAGDEVIPEKNRVLDAIERSPKKAKIKILDFVPSHHLTMLYRLATLYVQPSFDEGFGLPVLDAMLQSCPVACSSLGSLPEVGGQAVAYFDPHKEGQMAKVIDEVLLSPARRRELVMLGHKQVDRFSWSTTAELTRGVYEQVRAA